MADELPGAALLRELANFRVTITAKANEMFAAVSGEHNDLALAFWGNRMLTGG